jgi:hypothetical protein
LSIKRRRHPEQSQGGQAHFLFGRQGSGIHGPQLIIRMHR